VEKESDTDASTVENGAVLGVDLNGDGSLAVTSTGEFLGNADSLKHRCDEYERRRGRLQQTGTRSAHLSIQSIGSRFARWSRDYLHRVSKAIVQEPSRLFCDCVRGLGEHPRTSVVPAVGVPHDTGVHRIQGRRLRDSRGYSAASVRESTV
jgi:hypothetical protein